MLRQCQQPFNGATKVGKAALVLFLFALGVSVGARAEQNLHTVRAQAQALQLPIVLYFSLPDCTYCRTLEEEVIHPMQKGRQFDNLAILVEVDLTGATILDFFGQPVAPQAFAQRYKVVVTPTLTFVDAQGKQLLENVIGLPNLAYFGFEFREMMQTAREKIRAVD